MIRNSISGEGVIRARLQSIQTGCGTLPPPLFNGLYHPGSEADRLHPFSAEIKNAWSCISVFLNVSHSRCVHKGIKMHGFQS